MASSISAPWPPIWKILVASESRHRRLARRATNSKTSGAPQIRFFIQPSHKWIPPRRDGTMKIHVDRAAHGPPKFSSPQQPPPIRRHVRSAPGPPHDGPRGHPAARRARAPAHVLRRVLQIGAQVEHVASYVRRRGRRDLRGRLRHGHGGHVEPRQRGRTSPPAPPLRPARFPPTRAAGRDARTPPRRNSPTRWNVSSGRRSMSKSSRSTGIGWRSTGSLLLQSIVQSQRRRLL